MKVRIVVKPSKIRDSNLWHYEVQEKINDKWHMACIFDKSGFRSFGGTTEDLEQAKTMARVSAGQYIAAREISDHGIHVETPKKLTYTEEIDV